MSMQPVVFADILARLRHCPECGETMVEPNPDWLDNEAKLMQRKCPQGHCVFNLQSVTPWGDIEFAFLLVNWRD